jgi:hypothetical protein
LEFTWEDCIAISTFPPNDSLHVQYREKKKPKIKINNTPKEKEKVLPLAGVRLGSASTSLLTGHGKTKKPSKFFVETLLNSNF